MLNAIKTYFTTYEIGTPVKKKKRKKKKKKKVKLMRDRPVHKS